MRVSKKKNVVPKIGTTYCPWLLLSIKLLWNVRSVMECSVVKCSVVTATAHLVLYRYNAAVTWYFIACGCTDILHAEPGEGGGQRPCAEVCDTWKLNEYQTCVHRLTKIYWLTHVSYLQDNKTLKCENTNRSFSKLYPIGHNLPRNVVPV